MNDTQGLANNLRFTNVKIIDPKVCKKELGKGDKFIQSDKNHEKFICAEVSDYTLVILNNILFLFDLFLRDIVTPILAEETQAAGYFVSMKQAKNIISLALFMADVSFLIINQFFDTSHCHPSLQHVSSTCLFHTRATSFQFPEIRHFDTSFPHKDHGPDHSFKL